MENYGTNPNFRKQLVKLNGKATEKQMGKLNREHTEFKDNNQFEIRKLVKRGAILTFLLSMSFKIDSNETDFDYLKFPSNWPKIVLLLKFTHKVKRQRLTTIMEKLSGHLNQRQKNRHLTNNTNWIQKTATPKRCYKISLKNS